MLLYAATIIKSPGSTWLPLFTTFFKPPAFSTFPEGVNGHTKVKQTERDHIATI
jgi:hypothetical protein